MSAFIGAAVKTPDEIKRYRIDYTDWLDIGETVLTVDCSATGDGTLPTFPGSLVDVNGLGVTLFIAGGDDGASYEAIIEITTSGGQTKQDALQVSVAAL